MLTVSASVDRTSLQRTLQGLRAFDKAQGLDVRFICFDLMRAWVLDMVKYSAPWGGGSAPGNSKAQRNTGQAAITFDLFGGSKMHGRKTLGAFGIYDDAKVAKTFNDKLSGHPIIVLKSGAVFGMDKALFRPEANEVEMHQHHMALRGKNGRVSQAGARDRRVGRWKFFDKMFVRKATAMSYLKSVQDRVGTLKAGWLPALYRYASLSNGSQGRLPQWIKRQSIPSGGSSGMMDATGNGAIYAWNTAPHSRAIRESQVTFTQRKQENSMRRFGAKRIQRLCDQFNAGRVPTPLLKSAA